MEQALFQPRKIYDDHESFLRDLEDTTNFSTNSERIQQLIFGSERPHGDRNDELDDDDAEDIDEADQEKAAFSHDVGFS